MSVGIVLILKKCFILFSFTFHISPNDLLNFGRLVFKYTRQGDFQNLYKAILFY